MQLGFQNKPTIFNYFEIVQTMSQSGLDSDVYPVQRYVHDVQSLAIDIRGSESPSLNHVSHQVWLKLAKWFMRRSRLKEKVNRRTDGRRTNCDGNSSLVLSLRLRWAKNKKQNKTETKTFGAGRPVR